MSSSFVIKGVIANHDLEEALKVSDLWTRLSQLTEYTCDTVEELVEMTESLEGWEFADKRPRKIKVEVTIE